MALTRIDDIQLYMGMTAEAADCYAVKEFLQSHNVAYQNYMYADDSQHPELLAALSSWKLQGAPEVMTKFPFIIYTEVDFDLPPSQFKRVCIYGKDAILASDIVAKFALGR
jgi:hypothetical protein